MKKFFMSIFVIVIALTVTLTGFGCSSSATVTEDKYDYDTIPGYWVMRETVPQYSTPEMAEEMMISKIESSKGYVDISPELSAIRKAGSLEHKVYWHNEENKVEVKTYTMNANQHSSQCEPEYISTKLEITDDNCVRVIAVKEQGAGYIEILNVPQKGYADMFHSYKKADINFYISNGSDLYVVRQDTAKLIATDYFSAPLTTADDVYYISQNMELKRASDGAVIEENVYGVSGNEFSCNYLTIYK